MNSAKKLRKQIFVDPQVQGGIVARLMGLWIAASALAIVVALLLQFFANPTGGISKYLSEMGQHLLPLVMAFAVTLPIAVLHLLRFTHRFAGPVVRLRRSLSELAAGKNPPRLKFRDGDYWQEMAGHFNNVANTLAESQARVAELEAQIADAGNKTSVTDTEPSESFTVV